jgi:ABC-2 type transport system ATP-binding protein
LKKEGRTVLFSTHILSDAETLCDRVGVIVGGKLRGVGTPGELVGMKTSGLEILFELSGARKTFPLLETATKTGESYRVHVSEEDLYGALEQLKCAEARILLVTRLKPSLEEFFMNLVDADRAQANAVDVSGK